MKIAVTGANSSVGQNLIDLIAEFPEISVIAGARSSSSSSFLKSDNIKRAIIAYDNPDSLGECFSGADCVVHLAGILIEDSHSNYQTANVDATAAVVAAAQQANVKRIVFISVVGANTSSDNGYFRSKGEAEALVSNSTVAGTIIRTPILLGANTAGTRALISSSEQGSVKLLGGGKYIMRPLDVGDLCRAIVKCCMDDSGSSRLYELVGPEPVTYRDLVSRVAAMTGRQVSIKSFPVWAAKCGALLRNLVSPGGMTTTVIDVITRNEVVDSNADQELGVELTPLDLTLQSIVTRS